MRGVGAGVVEEDGDVGVGEALAGGLLDEAGDLDGLEGLAGGREDVDGAVELGGRALSRSGGVRAPRAVEEALLEAREGRLALGLRASPSGASSLGRPRRFRSAWLRASCRGTAALGRLAWTTASPWWAFTASRNAAATGGMSRSVAQDDRPEAGAREGQGRLAVERGAVEEARGLQPPPQPTRHAGEEPEPLGVGRFGGLLLEGLGRSRRRRRAPGGSAERPGRSRPSRRRPSGIPVCPRPRSPPGPPRGGGRGPRSRVCGRAPARGPSGPPPSRPARGARGSEGRGARSRRRAGARARRPRR